MPHKSQQMSHSDQSLQTTLVLSTLSQPQTVNEQVQQDTESCSTNKRKCVSLEIAEQLRVVKPTPSIRLAPPLPLALPIVPHYKPHQVDLSHHLQVTKETLSVTSHHFRNNNRMPAWELKKIHLLMTSDKQSAWLYTNRITAGSYGAFHLAIDNQLQAWGIKSFSGKVDMQLPISKRYQLHYPTTLRGLFQEIYLQNAFSPAIGFRYVLQHKQKYYAFLPAMPGNSSHVQKAIASCQVLEHTSPIYLQSVGSTLAKLLLLDIATTLQKLHRCRFVHGDITLSNILIHPDGLFVLSDYGNAAPINYPKQCASTCGVFRFQAAEVLQHYIENDEKMGSYYPASDIYSLGRIISYYLYTKQDTLGPPEGHESAQLCYEEQMNFHQWFEASVPLSTTAQYHWQQRWELLFSHQPNQVWRTLLEQMLASSPKQRPHASSCLQWIESNLSSEELNLGRKLLRHLAKCAGRSMNEIIDYLQQYAMNSTASK